MIHYRGRGKWVRTGTGWEARFEPPLKIPSYAEAGIDVPPPPPWGAEEFALEVDFKKLPWHRRYYLLLVVAMLIAFAVSAAITNFAPWLWVWFGPFFVGTTAGFAAGYRARR